MLNVKSLRELFFRLLIPFIAPAFRAIDTRKQEPKNFNDFFSEEYYLQLIEEEVTDFYGEEQTKKH